MSLKTVLSALARMFTLPKTKNSLEDVFGQVLGSYLRGMLKIVLEQKVSELVVANYKDPDALAQKLASDINAAIDPLLGFIGKIGDMFFKGGGLILENLAKDHVYQILKDDVTEKLGSQADLTETVYNVISKATKL